MKYQCESELLALIAPTGIRRAGALRTSVWKANSRYN